MKRAARCTWRSPSTLLLLAALLPLTAASNQAASPQVVFSARLQAQLSKVGVVGPATLAAACKNSQAPSAVRLVVGFKTEADLPGPRAADYLGLTIVARVQYARFLVLDAAGIDRGRLTAMAGKPGISLIDVDCPVTIERVSLAPPAGLNPECTPSREPLLSPPNDPEYVSGRQSGLLSVHAPEAWKADRKRSTVLVAVMDGDINTSDPDLVDGLWANRRELTGKPNQDDDGNALTDDQHGFDFVDGDPDPSECRVGCDSHGTHVTGTILAEGDNKYGTVGVLWNGTYLPIRIVPPETKSKIQESVLAQAISYALESGASIINMSFHWFDEDAGLVRETLRLAIPGERTPRGTLIVAALGDDGINVEEQIRYPLIYAKHLPNVIPAAAYTNNMDPTLATNLYPGADVVAAPGKDVFSTARRPIEACAYGSSSSAAFVSGAAALVWSDDRYASCTAVEMKTLLLKAGKQVEMYAPGNPQPIGRQVKFLSVGFLAEDDRVFACGER